MSRLSSPNCGPCNLTQLAGLHSDHFVRRVSDPGRCPGACIPKGALVIDGGTSYDPGDALNWLKFKREWNVMAFDPLPENCEKAARALMPYGKRARFVCKALGREQGTATFHADGQQQGSLSQKRSRSSNSSLEVPVTTLDDEVGGAHVFLMKLDLQGSELDALRGASRLLREERLSWLYTEFAPNLVQDAGHSSKEVLDFLKDAGFVCRNFRERSYRPWWCNDVLKLSNGKAVDACWTDLLCGHKRVASLAGNWENQILSQYCNHQTPFCNDFPKPECSAMHRDLRNSCKGKGPRKWNANVTRHNNISSIFDPMQPLSSDCIPTAHYDVLGSAVRSGSLKAATLHASASALQPAMP